MKKIFSAISVLFCLMILSCSQSNNKSIKAEMTTNSAETVPISIIYGINGEDIPIMKSPSKKSDKLINEKATKSIGETQYCEVDYSTKVEVLEKKENWVKIKVVEPEWLSDLYIGWIPAKYIITVEEQEKQSLDKLDPKEYELLKTEHNSAVENYHVLLKHKGFDKNYVYQFIKAFRKENCKTDCNINIYDSKSIEQLIGIYPLPDKDYLKFADHLISVSTFDATEVRDWYPYQDFHYKELGGKNWKKKPIK